MKQYDEYNIHNHPKRIKSILITTIVITFLLSTSHFLRAAEYRGRDVDGETFSCTAYSYSTGRYYYGQVEFSGDDAILYFQNGGQVTLTIDDEEIDDPNSISAYDYTRGIYWELDVDDL